MRACASSFYSNRFTRLSILLRRNGVKTVLLSAPRQLAAPWLLKLAKAASFPYEGRTLPYFYHRYNLTWLNERCIEIPFILDLLKDADPNQTMEVGNVLAHYKPVSHTIIDKYEQGKGVLNHDITDFKSARQFQHIVSISTFEHIGFDESTGRNSAESILRAFHLCIEMLADGGILAITAPIGYNPSFDQLIRDESLHPAEASFYIRTERSRWSPATIDRALESKYSQPFPYANAVVFLIVRKTS